MTINEPSPFSVPPAESLPDPGTLTEMASLLFDHIEGQLSRADNKAQLILAADTFLAAALTLSGGGIRAIFGAGMTLGETLSNIAGVLLFLSLIISIFFAVLASKPILKAPQQERNLFFFGHITDCNPDEFTDQFLNQSEDDIREALLGQVYTKSLIASYKFKRVGRSTNFLIIALALWAISQVVLLVIP
ncbi:MAG: hypothetical protein JXJ17_16745 [Anaerolineae bacterium]|nr:hypothetical protein [Anaerolineae bacterium]